MKLEVSPSYWPSGLNPKDLSLLLTPAVNFWNLSIFWYVSSAVRALLLWCCWETRLEGVNVHSQPVQLDSIGKEGSFSRPQETEGGFGQVTGCEVGQPGRE